MPIGDKITHLLLAISTATLAEEARLMAAVVLRRLFTSEFQEFYPLVSLKPIDTQSVIHLSRNLCHISPIYLSQSFGVQ